MRFLFYLAVLVAGYFAWQWYQRQQADDSAQHTGDCREVELSATALPTNGSRPWDENSPPDLMFQAGSHVTPMCPDSLTCTQALNLGVPSRRFELQLLDRDGDGTEVVSSGWVHVGMQNVPLGRATISVRCLQWTDE